MGHKGIVIKVKEDDAIVLSQENAYIRVRLKGNMAVGQKIMFTDDDIVHTRDILRGLNYMSKKIAIAVVMLLILTAGGVFGYNKLINGTEQQKIASVMTIDINPSVEVYLNENEEVVKVESLNDDAKTLDLSGIIGKDAGEAVETIVTLAREAGFINDEDLDDDYVLVTTVPMEGTDETVVDEINTIIEEKIEESEELQNVSVAMIKASLVELREAQEKKVPVGLLVVNGGIMVDGQKLTVKEYFATQEGLDTFMKKGKVVEKSFEKKAELVEKYLDELEAEDVDVDSLREAFDLAKADFFEAKKLFEVAKEEYKKALESGDEAKIAAAKLALEQAEAYKDLMEQNKDDVEAIKEQVKKQLEATEEEEDSEAGDLDDAQDSEDEKNLEENRVKEEKKGQEEKLKEEKKPEVGEALEEGIVQEELDVEDGGEDEQRLEDQKRLEAEKKQQEEKLKEDIKKQEEQKREEEKRLEEENKKKEEQSKNSKKP